MSAVPDARPAPSASPSDPALPSGPSALSTSRAARAAADSLPNLGEMDAKCGGCAQVIDQESGGVVVAFGSTLWHVDCFRCAKCKDRVSADTNLLLLSDGSPVCSNCSYQCSICRKPITEEAIMTGDESYHAACFTCRTCKRRIEELVFAKTSQGIYCMACHNERVARSRRHAEQRRARAARKEQREKAESSVDLSTRAGSDLGSSLTSVNGVSTPNLSQPDSSPTMGESPAATPHTVMSAKFSGHDVTTPVQQPAGLDKRDMSGGDLTIRDPASANGSPRRREMSLPASPSVESVVPAAHQRSATASPALESSASVGLGVGPVPGLGVPTSRAERRRSINPAMTFNMDAQNSTFTSNVEPRMSPLPPSPLRASFTDLAGELPNSSPPSPTVEKRGPPTPDKVVQGDAPVAPPRTTSMQELAHLKPPSDEAGLGSPAKIADAPAFDAGGTPQLGAPSLPAMSFSLSDPDFAVILNGIEEQAPPSISRSPQMNLLASAADHTATERSPSPALDREHLTPHDRSPPAPLRQRQISAESTVSVSSRVEPDSALSTLVQLVAAAKHGEEPTVTVDVAVASAIIRENEQLRDTAVMLKNKYNGARRSSQQYSEGLTVAGEEYDKELALRRDLEAEVTRLRAQVHAQTARLSVISSDERRQENLRRRSHDLASSLTGLERDISRLRAQRDMTLAEVEELHRRQSLSVDGDSTAGESSAATAAGDDIGAALTSRLDTIKEQYSAELEPLSAQREALAREIAELRETREQFLEESTALAAKNEELAELNTQLLRQTENMQDALRRTHAHATLAGHGASSGAGAGGKMRSHPSGSPSLSSLATSATLPDVPEETARVVKVHKPEPIEAAPARRFKWYKSSKGPESIVAAHISKPLPPPKQPGRPSTELGLRDHSFHQYSTMRLTRCELCQEKMWGLQEVKCSSCGIVCHAKCSEKLPRSCSGSRAADREPESPLPPSMFGKDLSEQLIQDGAAVPVIVTKCIDAVEAVGMEYEGIYRKTGGTSQIKQITQLFERGDYDAFDLADLDVFNDISSITSVLKNYFRQLPDPLLTHTLHESFVAAAMIRDPGNKHQALCALLAELPAGHYATLRAVMGHLHRVTKHAGVNLMTSQNLGVVFGPTLMRSSDPNREFADMAGKALSVQWMVENAPAVFVDRA